MSTFLLATVVSTGVEPSITPEGHTYTHYRNSLTSLAPQGKIELVNEGFTQEEQYST